MEQGESIPKFRIHSCTRGGSFHISLRTREDRQNSHSSFAPLEIGNDTLVQNKSYTKFSICLL